MTVVTRFAPSPTGILHIGNARTGLFNWLYARHHKGKFLLRIEDTDKERSTEEAIKAIYDGLSWLGIDWDGDAVLQSKGIERHQSVAHELIAAGLAYYCYCTPDELVAMKEKAKAEGRPMVYDGRWRDKSPSEAPKDIPPVVRFKAPKTGTTLIKDAVQGNVVVENDTLDDMVLLRADGTPTYMLSVIVDDHDMGVNTIIRGDDHLINAARQSQLITALGWNVPQYAHIPLIHGPDGKKLSKRHGALGVMAYADMGYLPSAMKNYLCRLGWSHGDEDIFTTEQAIHWFSLEAINKAPARLDFDKLDYVDQQHLQMLNGDEFVTLYEQWRSLQQKAPLTSLQCSRLKKSYKELSERIHNFAQLEDVASYLLRDDVHHDFVNVEKMINDDMLNVIEDWLNVISGVDDFTETRLQTCAKEFLAERNLKLGKVGPTLRALLTGQKSSPSIFQVMEVLGKNVTIERLQNGINIRRPGSQ